MGSLPRSIRRVGRSRLTAFMQGAMRAAVTEWLSDNAVGDVYFRSCFEIALLLHGHR